MKKHVSGYMDTSEGQTLLCDCDGTSDALSKDNDVLRSPVHNTATGSSSYVCIFKVLRLVNISGHWRP